MPFVWSRTCLAYAPMANGAISIGASVPALSGAKPLAAVSRRAQIPALDGVRGLAILLVVIHNASWVLADSARLPMKLVISATAAGWIGVQLFFVLSGFLITSILLETRRSEHYLRNFYVRRVLRIFPLYYAFLFVALVIAPRFADPDWAVVAHKNQWWLWTFTFNWGAPLGHGINGLSHFWSLAVEEQFYFFWPFLVLLLSRRQLIAVCIGAMLVTPLVRLGLRLDDLPGGAYEFTVARWDALAGGALLAILMTTDDGRTWLAQRVRQVGLASSVLLVTCVLVTHGFREGAFWVQVVGQSMTVLVFSLLVHASVAPASPFEVTARDALSTAWLRFLGKYSYAIYIFHYPIQAIGSHYLADVVNGADDSWRLLRWALYVVGVAALSILAALGSWHLLERRFLALKDRYTVRDTEPAPAMPPASAG